MVEPLPPPKAKPEEILMMVPETAVSGQEVGERTLLL
jgi:hypothetical protein